MTAGGALATNASFDSLPFALASSVRRRSASFDHHDLRDHLVEGYNALEPGQAPSDVPDGQKNYIVGHGTAIAGIIARLFDFVGWSRPWDSSRMRELPDHMIRPTADLPASAVPPVPDRQDR